MFRKCPVNSYQTCSNNIKRDSPKILSREHEYKISKDIHENGRQHNITKIKRDMTFGARNENNSEDFLSKVPTNREQSCSNNIERDSQKKLARVHEYTIMNDVHQHSQKHNITKILI